MDMPPCDVAISTPAMIIKDNRNRDLMFNSVQRSKTAVWSTRLSSCTRNFCDGQNQNCNKYFHLKAKKILYPGGGNEVRQNFNKLSSNLHACFNGDVHLIIRTHTRRSIQDGR